MRVRIPLFLDVRLPEGLDVSPADVQRRVERMLEGYEDGRECVVKEAFETLMGASLPSILAGAVEDRLIREGADPREMVITGRGSRSNYVMYRAEYATRKIRSVPAYLRTTRAAAEEDEHNGTD